MKKLLIIFAAFLTLLFSVTAEAKDVDIDAIISEAAGEYCLDPAWISVIIDHESSRHVDAQNGNHIGLMQISTYWHADRAKKLGVDDMWDPYGNVLIGCDILYELANKYEDPHLVLMCYNEGEYNALKRYKDGIRSGYAKSIMSEYYEKIMEE